MKALLKIEWIKTWRSWPVFIMSIGMPVGFFLLYSGMEMSPDPESQKAFILSSPTCLERIKPITG